MASQNVCMRAKGKLVDQVYQKVCDLTEWIIYIAWYKQTLVRFLLRSSEIKLLFFISKLYISSLILV